MTGLDVAGILAQLTLEEKASLCLGSDFWHTAPVERLGYGWGTLLTNDFRGLGPDGRLDPFSIVCKVVSANGRAAVKLSDNPAKAMGPPAELARYHRVFEVGEQASLPVAV